MSARTRFRLHPRRLTSVAVTTVLAASLSAGLPSLLPAQAASPGAPAAASPGTRSQGDADGLTIENSFVSSQGWVKPGDQYPSRILLGNETGSTISGATVTITAPRGSTFLDARGPGDHPVTADRIVWTPGDIAAGANPTLVLESRAASTSEEPTIVWRDLSSKAVLDTSAARSTVVSHGPKVIPPGEAYETAKYGDRPFPVVPVEYTDRDYQPTNTGDELEAVINDPKKPGSTFNLFQEMSLGQLYPKASVGSAGLDGVGFDYAPGFDFTNAEAGQTCTGATLEDAPVDAEGTPAYPTRISNGVYNLPGDTAYYGSDANGSALVGAVAGVGALQQIDAGCGSPGKLVYDAAVIADPEIDYSDFDTDKDGVVDFFMAVFAGCGGHGSSQLSVAGCDYPGAPYDNVWPHSSSLEFYYSDPETGLPGYTTDDQLKNLEGQPLWYTDKNYSETTTTDMGDDLKVFVRVGPYNVNPETAIDKASVISHEYGHSLGLPDFYSTGSRETYGDWNLMATDKSQNMDVFSRQELGWVVPEVLKPGTSPTVTGWTDSKQDTNAIKWQTPNGTPYTLTEGTDGRVQNSQAYVAKLPGRQLIDPAKFDTGDKATRTHAWWSGSGNDFGCAPAEGRNFDLAVPGLADLPKGSKVTLDFKSLWDIEWDFDYGFVLTTTDGGESYTSNPSENGYTTSNTDPLAGNPNANSCQQKYDNGLTGTSGSYAAGSESTDRKLGEYPDSVFLADSYDISELAGEPNGALRFSYSSDPGVAKPGWFIDDVKVTATTPSGEQVLLDTDFETSGGPDDARVFNGGCRENLTTSQRCTLGWRYVAAGSEAAADHAYYMELRDRSGFDFDGHGQVDRDPIGFAPGLSLVYTDEAHGYGNAGTDDPPAQSPLDSQPEPGESAPNLDDAAYTAADRDSSYTDSGMGHTDNYEDPGNSEADSRYPEVSNPWRFRYNCLAFNVLSMLGDTEGPATSDGDLTGDVAFRMGEGCGAFDYGYGATDTGVDAPANARFTVRPLRPTAGDRVVLNGGRSTDDRTDPTDLLYSWDFGNGGRREDATGPVARTVFKRAGVKLVTLTVTDRAGNSDTVTHRIRVRR